VQRLADNIKFRNRFLVHDCRILLLDPELRDLRFEIGIPCVALAKPFMIRIAFVLSKLELGG
jgi:hypothetical protein